MSTPSNEKEERKIAQEYHLAKSEGQRLLEEPTEEESQILGEGYYRLAKVYYDKADLEMAKDYFLKTLQNTEYPRDVFVIFKCYGFLIRIFSETQNEEEAQKYIEEAEKIIDLFQRNAGTLNSNWFYNSAMVCTYKGDFEEALEKFQLSYQSAQKENEPELMAKGLYGMANAYLNLKNYKEASLRLEQLKELLMILQKDYLKGSMYMLLGHVNRETGNYEEANKSYDEAIRFLQHKNCWNLFGYILLGKGRIAKKKGEFAQALTFFKIASQASNDSYIRLRSLIQDQIEDVNDSSVDLYLDRHNRMIHEKDIGAIDFKHRFVLLEILFLLAKNPGQSYNKDDLARSIWKDEYNPLIHDKLIYTSISRLRKLIEPKGSSRKYILRGKDGYTFNPRVKSRFHKEDDSISKKIIGNVDMNAPV